MLPILAVSGLLAGGVIEATSTHASVSYGMTLAVQLTDWWRWWP